MALTRSDEGELLTALHDGLHEEPRFGIFLQRLRRRLRADRAALVVRQGSSALFHVTETDAGSAIRVEAGQADPLARLGLLPFDRLRPGRVYAADELADQAGAWARPGEDGAVPPGGSTGSGRFLRIVAPGGPAAGLILLRDGPPFTAAVSATLAALVPHLGIALRTLAVLEGERLRATVAQDLLSRAGIGWAAADWGGHIVLASPDAGPLLAAGSARLAVALADAERAAAGSGEVVPVQGRQDRWLLALPITDPPLAAPLVPALLAVGRTLPRLSPRHAALLAQQHGLGAGEARLAVLLAQGLSIAEAASALGLTLETARNYSKRLYAKTGTRGQGELVRLVLGSVALLA